MGDDLLKVAILTNVLSTYREGFYDRLFSLDDLFVKVYCQDSLPGINLKTIHHKYPANVKLIGYLSAKYEKLSWQFFPWKEIFANYDVVFVDGNPRHVSQAILSSILRMFGKKVVLWTQAHSYSANSFTEKIRLAWSKQFKYVLVYNDTEVQYLRDRGFTSQEILGQNNGLDQDKIEIAKNIWTESRLSEWRTSQGLYNRTILLSCARLVPKNQFRKFIQILPEIVAKIPNTVWCVIGSGSERVELEDMVSAAGLKDHVRFVGELYIEVELAPWFLVSELFIHPAAIGLSIMHAFGYGLPVITHGNSSRHGPEYAAFKNQRTGWSYQEGNFQHLAEVVVSSLKDENTRANMKCYVLRLAREKYNVNVMVERFVQIAKSAVR